MCDDDDENKTTLPAHSLTVEHSAQKQIQLINQSEETPPQKEKTSTIETSVLPTHSQGIDTWGLLVLFLQCVCACVCV
jgi:gamma-glutamyltranspeptidase